MRTGSNEVGAAIGNPGPADKMFETGTWVDFQSPTCKKAGGTNERRRTTGKKLPCNRGVLRWDWGDSWSLARGQAVTAVIGSRVTNTIILMTTVTVISLAIAIPIGIISAVQTIFETGLRRHHIQLFRHAMPVFWFGLLMIILFTLEIPGVGLALLPVG